MQRSQRGVVLAVGLLDESTEIIDASQLRIGVEGLLDIRFGRLGFAFLNQRPRDVQPTIGITGLRFGDLFERVLGAFEIALQEHSDAPIVPALPVGLLGDRRPLRLA